MARYDVYPNPEASERRYTPYFLDVQNDYIDGLHSRVVIPLRRESSFGPRARDLHPLLTVAGESYVLDTAAIGAVELQDLRKPVARVPEAGLLIAGALGTLFGSF